VSQYDEGIVDVERRTKEVGQILGDPTLFPVEFLSWIKRFIEQSGIQLPVSSIIGTFTPGAGSLRGMIAGLVLPFGGPTAPPGSLACNGQSISRTEYGLLFAAIGATWGSADAASFNVPDLRDRALYGAGTALAIAQTDGAAAGSRGPRHRHTVTDPGHKHTYNQLVGGPANVAAGSNFTGQISDVSSSTTGITVGPAGTPLDAPSHAGILYVITTGA
jgi:microcystin-dependent protein